MAKLISYAQNFEDVMLWRALGHVKHGYYIDVGAQDPIIDSVSMVFYEQGWHGVHIEPLEYYAKMLKNARPNDIVIQAAISDQTGTMSFYEIAGGGISTGNPKVASMHIKNGLKVQKISVPCITLDEIATHTPLKEIHWLKIDVEGGEKKVLEGWSLEYLRPWIVVIESTVPLSKIESYQEWEHLILAKGYNFAYFDGLNRFYIANNHAELFAAFSSGPNVFDNFSLSGLAWSNWCDHINDKLQSLHTQIAQDKIDTQLKISDQILTSQYEHEAEKNELIQQYYSELKKQQDQYIELKRLTDERINQLNHTLQQRQSEAEIREQYHTEYITILQSKLANELRSQIQREREFNVQLYTIRKQAEAEKTQIRQSFQVHLDELLRQNAVREQHNHETIFFFQNELIKLLQSQELRVDEITEQLLSFRKLIYTEQAEREQIFNQKLQVMEQELDALRNGLIWRLTLPLRIAAGWFKKLIGNDNSINKNANITMSKSVLKPAGSDEIQAVSSFLPIPEISNMINSQTTQLPLPSYAPSLDTLMQYQGKQFIEFSYLTILKRNCDPEGLNYYLTRINTGVPKIQIIGQLLNSQEARTKNAKFSGSGKAIVMYKLILLPVFGPIVKIFFQQNKLSYNELSKFNGIKFVENCYINLLHREADPTGKHYYSSLLNAGEEKFIIIRNILNSEEGRKIGKKVKGIWLRYSIKKLEDIPVIGQIIALITLIIQAKAQLRFTRRVENSLSLIDDLFQINKETDPEAYKGVSLDTRLNIKAEVWNELEALLDPLRNIVNSLPHASRTNAKLFGEIQLKLNNLLEQNKNP